MLPLLVPRVVRLLFVVLLVHDAIRLRSGSSSSSSSSSSTTMMVLAAEQQEQYYDPKEAISFRDFIAHNDTMTCTATTDSFHTTTRAFNNQIRGVNLGGWMVLEPWITPSLFYQFLGGGEGTTAFDSYTFCEVLSKKYGNTPPSSDTNTNSSTYQLLTPQEQLRNHWEKWVTEDIIKELADSGAVSSVRLPLGDFQFIPYGPYKTYGCWDHSLEYVDRLLDWCYSYGLTVLLDLHTMKDSQNGFDNSGQAMGFRWTSALNAEFAGQTTFEHWPIRSAYWVGNFSGTEARYTSYNWDNLQHGLDVIQAVVDRYSGHPAVLGLTPVNEPWEFIPIELLKRWYWDGYLIVKKKASYWKYVMHDSFRFDTNIWGGYMKDCPDRALDTHIYQAWNDPNSRLGFYTDACGQKTRIAQMENIFGPVIVGEWSLATDNCAMWLNGFNDNLPGFPRSPCKYTPCRESYLGTQQPGVPIDPAKSIQGPYGTGMSGPEFGLCPGDRDWLVESSGNPYTGRDWVRAPPAAPKNKDDTHNVMKNLALKKIDAFAGIGHGYFFWNFRTDLYEPQWNYLLALELGWIPRGSFTHNEKVLNACAMEDAGDFKCALKHGQLDSAILGAVKYVFDQEDVEPTSNLSMTVLNMTGTVLEQSARLILNDYFQKYRFDGATCDFGGIAYLVQKNRTLTDDDNVFDFYDDDEYGVIYVVEESGPAIWELILGGTVIACLAGLFGFVCAMRTNPTFNQRVRSSSLMKPLTNSKLKLVRSSLALPDLDQLDGELAKLVKEQDKVRQSNSDGGLFF